MLEQEKGPGVSVSHFLFQSSSFPLRVKDTKGSHTQKLVYLISRIVAVVITIARGIHQRNRPYTMKFDVI